MEIIGDEHLDVTGDLAVIGAAAQPRAVPSGILSMATRGGALPQVAAAIPQPSWMRGQAGVERGVSLPNEELDFLPFDPVVFTSVTPAILPATSFPQRPFRGERLVISAVQSIGGVVSDGLFRIDIDTAIYVGAVQIGATQGRTPALAFAPTAFGVRLSMPRAGQGTRVAIPLFVTGAIAVGDSVTVRIVLFGRAVR